MNEIISVIIPVYNVENYLNRCLDSVCNQTYRNLEIILINDGSTDRSGIICDEYAMRDKRVQVVHVDNGGVSAARNKGLDICTGDYITFVDSDDYIDLDIYNLMLSKLHQYGVSIAATGILQEIDVDNWSIIRCPDRETLYEADAVLKEILLCRNIGVSVWSKLYKAELFKELRFPVGEVNEEINILLNTYRKSKMIHIGLPKYHYMVRQGSLTSGVNVKGLSDMYKNANVLEQHIDRNNLPLKREAMIYKANVLYNAICMYSKNNISKTPEYKKYFEEYKKIWTVLLKYNEYSVKKKLSVLMVRIGLYKLLVKLFKK